jgi:hypothetical protein
VRRATGKPGVRSNSLEPTQTIWIEDKIVPLSLLEVGHDTSDIGGSFSKRSCVVTAVQIDHSHHSLHITNVGVDGCTSCTERIENGSSATR